MSLTTLRIAMWLALIATLGCGFFMAYSLMFIAAAFLCFLVFLVLVFVVGFKDGRLPGKQRGATAAGRTLGKLNERTMLERAKRRSEPGCARC
jgi:hypothetical protein